MSKEIYISSTPQETRLAIVEKDELTEIYYERENEYTLAGSIYNGRVTRVLPGMQSSFVDIGLERDAFLYITDFMEEAGDSADFGGGGEARGGRGDKPKAESQSEGRSESRSEGRSEGRGEGRGRGRRDGRGGEGRGREAQREPGADSGAASPQEEHSFEEPRSFVAVDFAAVEDETTDDLPRESGDEEIGEGAPGADGGRRWRGRRGRRRGRGVAGEQRTDSDGSDEPVGHGIEAASDHAPARDSEQQAEPRGEHGSREGGRDRGGRDRGGRDRDGERGGRDNRHDTVRERFAPRGARSSSAEDQIIDVNASASQVEPFILPGESLSKYRRGEGGAASGSGPVRAESNVVKAKPSTEVEPLVGWDGGLVLPGESLSRMREARPEGRSESPAEPRSEARNGNRNGSHGGDRAGGRDRRRGRDEQRGRGRQEYSAEPRGVDPAEAVLPAVTSQHDVAQSEYDPRFEVSTDVAQSGLAPAEMTGAAVEHEAEFQKAIEEMQESEPQEVEFQAAEFHEAEFHEAQFHETTTEYEPDENASASFRVDPAGQREFRQGSVVEAPAAETSELHEAATSEAHEFTNLQPTGELISDTPHAEISQPDSTSPMEHETAVQMVHAAEAERSAIPFAAVPEMETRETDAQDADTADAGTQGFVPGQGQLLEEELLDDEDSEIRSLHASASGDHDDMEEETLESSAGDAQDLGSMIRDMTIDDLTGIEPSETDEDEDNFEEDEDFEEDELAATGDEDFDEDVVSGSEISEAEEEEFAEASSFEENGSGAAAAEGEMTPHEGVREGGRRGRRDGRRGGRDRGERSGERDRGADRGGSRDRRGMANSRGNGGGRERGHRSMQSVNLPAISDLLKPGQEVLVQIAKEPIAKKGARITSHIALPGRFLVFMPTVNHTGVSRKIESDSERRRLKEILLSEKGDATGGFIVRTAAGGASEEELRSDLRFLLNLWADIKSRSESSKSPALIYHDLNLVERILRDQVTDNFSAIWVDTETEYERVLRFLQRFQPSLIRRVKLYTKDTPLFEQFGITEEINKALRAKVWLKSGGSIVINQTEALVAIDINTGKFVGKTARLEDTILKTNLDAIPEIVRQIRLRDLGGIIIIDFIDMDERKNRNKVMAALEEELKKDRAPSKVLQFNDFGLVAITRKRVKQSLERTLSTTCGVCAGTGMVKSPVTVCNDIYIEMRKMHKLLEKGDIMLRVNPEVVKQLKIGGGKWLQEMEEMSGKTILVKSDPSLHPEQFDIH